MKTHPGARRRPPVRSRVCLIDSGIDYSHPRVTLDGSSWAVREQVVTQVAMGDSSGHGTGCASVIASETDNSTLDSVRVFHDPAQPSSSTLLVYALDWAIDNAYDIICIPSSTTSARVKVPLLDLCERAAAKDIIIVCAASNTYKPSYPWIFGPVVSVGSHEGRIDNIEYCGLGGVDFKAGGFGLYVAWLNRSNHRVSGNSYAAGAVAGRLAKFVSELPHASATEHIDLLKHGAGPARSRLGNGSISLGPPPSAPGSHAAVPELAESSPSDDSGSSPSGKVAFTPEGHAARASPT